jgi:hypothetical protein
MEIICKLDLGTLSHPVYVLKNETSILTSYGKASTEELPNMLLAACSENNINKIHLFGNEVYLIGIIYEINQMKARFNDYKNIVVEVN